MIRNPQDPMTSRYALQDTVSPRSHEFMAYHLQPSTFNLSPKVYHLQPTTGRVGSGKLYYFLEFKFLESDRPSSSPVELPGTMLSMKLCIEWYRGPRSFKPRDIKIVRFSVLGFQGFATYPHFKVLGFQGLATIKILRSWVFRVSLHIKILRSWVSRVLRHNTISRSWVSRVPRQKGRARVQDPSRSQTLDSANPGSRTFLEPWHKSGNHRHQHHHRRLSVHDKRKWGKWGIWFVSIDRLGWQLVNDGLWMLAPRDEGRGLITCGCGGYQVHIRRTFIRQFTERYARCVGGGGGGRHAQCTCTVFCVMRWWMLSLTRVYIVRIEIVRE